MEKIQEYWVFWMFGIALGFTMMQLFAKSRNQDVQPGMATRSDDFSMRSTFLNFQSGEAALFFTVLATLICCFLFSVALARNVMDALPSFG